VDDSGFIVNGVQVEGPILACGDLWVLWDVRRLQDVTAASLALLDAVKPAPDIVVLGCGRRIGRPPAELVSALRRRGVAVEALDTVNAVATFNILNQEGRKVVGALLPCDAGAEGA
jgi:NADH dehydrogenase [ubiquinone] 1 alpha subcomplex assembly factor 3